MFIINFGSVSPIKGFFLFGNKILSWTTGAFYGRKEEKCFPTRDCKGINVSGSVCSITFHMVYCTISPWDFLLFFYCFNLLQGWTVWAIFPGSTVAEICGPSNFAFGFPSMHYKKFVSFVFYSAPPCDPRFFLLTLLASASACLQYGLEISK